ncbi:hypothetical protein FHR66_003901 [Xanthomonas sp. F4]|nr:hypothetical protein [Xanthomonas sp. 3498]MBB5942059.1 hypothetical protein [Xanthomonas sp. 3307]
MRRSLPCLLLLLLPLAAAHASNVLAEKPHTDCAYGDTPDADSAPTRAPATHAPSSTKPASTTTGGGSDSDLVPRMRMPKWHSFLPGMFR